MDVQFPTPSGHFLFPTVQTDSAPPPTQPLGTELKISGCTPSIPIRLNGGMRKEEKAELHLTL